MSEEAALDLPFLGEYAKSGRASCKACKTKIDKGELRLAAMVQSPQFDGKVPHWYHPKCFFTRNRPKAAGDIGNFDSLRWEDQEKLRQMIEDTLKGKGPTGNGKSTMSQSGTNMKDFRLEYAKSGASKCGVCEEKIKKGEVRAGKKEYESQRAKMYGPYDKWHHIDCFVDNRSELAFFDGGETMAGFMTLAANDQEMVKSKIKRTAEKTAADIEEPKPKKIKRDPDAEEEREDIKKQSKKIYYYRDQLERALKKNELQDLLESNGQEVPSGVDKMLDRLSDAMTFGAPVPCNECNSGQLVFISGGSGYHCTGNISEWTKCQFKTAEPKRKPFTVPPEFRERFSFLNLYKGKVGKRIVPHTPSTVTATQVSNGTKKKDPESPATAIPPLRGKRFVVEGDLNVEKIRAKIEGMGGTIDKKTSRYTSALILGGVSSAAKRKSKFLRDAEIYEIKKLSPDDLDGYISECREKLDAKRSKSSTSGSGFLKKELPKSIKLKLKGGGFVDPESNLEHKAHVLKIKDALYSVVLGAVNIQEGKNSFYKLQLLQHDKKHRWYVFRSWGRVGTTIGGNKTEEFSEKHDALVSFESLYEDKTGNRWSERNNFKKVPKKFFPMDLDYGQDNESLKKLEVANSKSQLHKAIQELVCLIFDVESMKKAMVEFEIDLTKMPLGKLSRKQIESAYKILAELQDMVKGGTGTETKYLDASNRFFTLIPHDFGMEKPPVLSQEDSIKSKLDMLDNLLEIEVAYNLIKTSSEDDTDKDPIDAHYGNLKTHIEVLDKISDEFKILEKYVKNTHASTHSMYKLEIEEIFKIARKGENKRFKPFMKLDNRMLLWHGSRTTNYAGILSQGLRIAPPEAPVTGYMFGKGIYFADMVSKSANYCCTTRSSNTGLLLLCDVALGDMYERTQADYIEKLPSGKHSTKGMGKTEPDPKEFMEIGGAKVPLGKPMQKNDLSSSLLYNEYIVYDVAQVQSKYLLRVKFLY